MRKRAESVLLSSGYLVAVAPPRIWRIECPAIAALVDFAAQNAGLEAGNYYNLRHDRGATLRDGIAGYRSDARRIAKAWGELVKAVHEARLVGVADAQVIEASKSAYSGRLTWIAGEVSDKIHEHAHAGSWNYTAGQYWCTEYRQAALAVMLGAITLRRQELPPQVRQVTTIAELKALNHANGNCWFDRSTMKYFGTRIESGILPGNRFVTSEQPPHGPRQFSVRIFDDKGGIDTVGEFCDYSSRGEAMAAARNLEAVPV